MIASISAMRSMVVVVAGCVVVVVVDVVVVLVGGTVGVVGDALVGGLVGGAVAGVPLSPHAATPTAARTMTVATERLSINASHCRWPAT